MLSSTTSWPGLKRRGDRLAPSFPRRPGPGRGLVQRGRNADQQGVGFLEAGHLGRRLKLVPFPPLGDDLRVDVLDVAGAGVERVDFSLVDVEAERAEPGGDEGVDKRQADVAQPDHADESRLIANGVFERIAHRGCTAG